MNHSDDTGLVMPPTVALHQIVVIPIVYKEQDGEACLKQAKDLANQLRAAGLRVNLDDRSGKNPGWKFSEWELKGVPLRIELGPKDMQNQTVKFVRRDTGEKSFVTWAELVPTAQGVLTNIHETLFNRAKKAMDENIIRVTEWEQFLEALSQ